MHESDERADTPPATPDTTLRVLEWLIGICVLVFSILAALALLDRPPL